MIVKVLLLMLVDDDTDDIKEKKKYFLKNTRTGKVVSMTSLKNE